MFTKEELYALALCVRKTISLQDIRDDGEVQRFDYLCTVYQKINTLIQEKESQQRSNAYNHSVIGKSWDGTLREDR